MKPLMNRQICVSLMRQMSNDNKDFILKLPKYLHDKHKSEKESRIGKNNAKETMEAMHRSLFDYYNVIIFFISV